MNYEEEDIVKKPADFLKKHELKCLMQDSDGMTILATELLTEREARILKVKLLIADEVFNLMLGEDCRDAFDYKNPEDAYDVLNWIIKRVSQKVKNAKNNENSS